MSLEEKLAKRDAAKLKSDRIVAIIILTAVWPLVFVLSWQLVLHALPVLFSDVPHREKMIQLILETWWLALPLLACHYRIKVLNRALGL